MPNYDKVLELVGPFGRYQKFLCIFYGGATAFYSAWVYYTLMFAVLEPKHACNATVIDWTDECGKNSTTGTCTEGHVYDFEYNQIGNTIPSEWDLICDKSVRVALIYTASQTGEVVGLFTVTYVMDNIGRRWCALLTNAWFLVTGLLMYFSSSVILLNVIAFFRGVALRMSFQLPWIICQEFCGSSYCSKVYLIMALSYALGLASLSLFSWVLPDWRWIVLLTTLPALMIVPDYFFLFESPRWLAAKGNFKEAERVLRKVAHINKVELKSIELADLLSEKESAESSDDEKLVKTTFLSLFNNGRNLAAKAIILCILNMVVYMVYMGLTYSMDNFHANPYLVTMLSALAEIPASFLSPLADRYGRIPLASATLFFSGTFALIGVVVPPNVPGLPIAVAVATKLSVALAFNYIIIIIAETYPTVVRATGTGLCCLASLLCGFGLPYIVYAARATSLIVLPMIVFSAAAFLGTFVVLLLPETKGLSLADTLEQEKLRKVGWSNARKNLRTMFARRAN